MLAEPWVLSIAMVAVFALCWGGVHVIRKRGERRQGVLMLVAAAVLLGNVMIQVWP